MVLVIVRKDAVINVPDKKTRAGKRLVKACELTILNQVVFSACSIAISPKPMSLEAGFDILECNLVVLSLDNSVNPPLRLLAPWEELENPLKLNDCTYKQKGELVDRRHHPMTQKP